MTGGAGTCGTRRGRRREAALAGRAAAVLLAACVLLTAGANAWVWAASAGHLQDAGSRADEATAPVAIVLGARMHESGRPSPWLSYRLDVAAELYRTGRVDALLVSGAGGGHSHDEPGAMRGYLVAAGVPSEAVVLDPHGYDTHDTCVRAHEVFGVERALLVTQDFHTPRAVALCRAAGIDAEGVADTRARADRAAWARSWLRERAAALKAGWDVLSGREPVPGGTRGGVEEAVAWTRQHRAGGAGAVTPLANPGPGPGTHVD